MGTGASDNSLRGPRDRARGKSRLRGTRRSRPQRIELERLEVRALLATIPAPAVPLNPNTGQPLPAANLSNIMGNVGGVNASMNSSAVVVDPHDPSKLVAVWEDNDPTMAAITLNGAVVAVEAAYSVDGGQTWLALFAEPTNTGGVPIEPELLNPATSGPTVPYAFVTNPSVGFDDADNFYILTEYSSGSAGGGPASSGALVLQKYDFAGSTPSPVAFTGNQQDPALYASGFFGSPTADLKVIYQWFSSGNNDSVLDPTLTVDSNLATLPPSVASVPDPTSGNVYVSWTTDDIPVYQNPLGGNFNPYRIATVVSSDGGNNFSPMAITDVNSDNGNDLNGEQGAAGGPTLDRDFNPAVTVSQGREPSESGLSGDPGIPGGQVAVTWDNAHNNVLMANTLSAGHDTSFGDQQSHFIPVASIDNTDFKIPVNLSNATNLDSLDVRVDIIDPSDQFLGLVLIAPNGTSTFTLQFNERPDGANEGVQTYSMNNIGDYELGTIFDDNATRFIGDKSEASPYFGDYVPDGGSLCAFLAGLGNGVNGTWTLETIDSNTSTSASPGFVLDWSLSFGRGLTPDNDVSIPVAGVPGLQLLPISSTNGTPTTTVPASPVAIGPGVVMAQDNTLGPDSPFEGRIYAVFTGYLNVTIDGVKNPTTNTDVFMTYSDDDGRSWSTPLEVNDDSGINDGTSGANEQFNGDLFEGKTQFQPAVAVDPATGTLVISWRDARNDANNTLLATYLATSIDGGNSFSAESYTNPSLTATDAITGQTDILEPEGDNGTSANSANATYGFGSSMGLAVYDGQVFPVWTGNFDEASDVNNAAVLNALLTLYRPIVIAAGPRIVDSTMGPIAYPVGSSGKVSNISFSVTFDRPINPPDDPSPSFTASDVQVFYHDTTFGDPSIQLDVLSVVPVASSGLGSGDKFGYTEFTVTFNPTLVPGGGSSGIGNYTGTYSYLITPDNEAGTPIVAPVRLLHRQRRPPAGHRADLLDAGAPADPHLGHGRLQHRR